MTNVVITSETTKEALCNAFVNGLLDQFSTELIQRTVNDLIFQYAYYAENWDKESKINIFLLRLIADTASNKKDTLFSFFESEEIINRVNDLIFQYAYYAENWDRENKDAIFLLRVIVETLNDFTSTAHG